MCEESDTGIEGGKGRKGKGAKRRVTRLRTSDELSKRTKSEGVPYSIGTGTQRVEIVSQTTTFG